MEKFFEKYTQYNCYHLYPIRYQILGNEDIINLMRYDILTSIIEKCPGILESEDGKSNSTFKKIFENIGYQNLMFDLISAMPKIGRPIQVVGKAFTDALRKSKVIQQDKDLSAMQNFRMQIENNQVVSSIDLVLRRCLNLAQEMGDDNKKNVLIVDDLDRMDPEHVFRILNILSARIETDEDNAWGFDHIILVGDIKNIKHIFRHRYGEGVDFQDYFDKFFSQLPYEFSNVEAVITWIESQMIESIKHHDALKQHLDSTGYIGMILRVLLPELARSKELNLRQLRKPTELVVPILSADRVKNPALTSTDARNIYLDMGLKMIASLFSGGKDEFVKALKNIKREYERTDRDLYGSEAARYFKLLSPDADVEPTHDMFYEAVINRTEGLLEDFMYMSLSGDTLKPK